MSDGIAVFLDGPQAISQGEMLPRTMAKAMSEKETRQE
jgi:hypothetical protein